jgi:hypothetical protein
MVIDYPKWDNFTDDEDNKNQPSSNTPEKSHNPLNHQLFDMGEYSVPIKREGDGNPQRLTWAQLDQKWDAALTEISRNPIFDAATATDDSALSTLFNTISSFVYTSVRNTELLAHGIERAAAGQSLTVTKYHVAGLVDPDVLGRSKMASACRTVVSIVMFFACPASISDILKVHKWVQAPGHWDGFMKDLKAGKESVQLRDEYSRVRKSVLENEDKDTMSLLVVTIQSRSLAENVNYGINLGYLVSCQHTFVIAIGNEGARIFQGGTFHDELPDISLEQWVSKGGARLRDEKEMEDLMNNFAVLR